MSFPNTIDENQLVEALKAGTTLCATEKICTVDKNNIPTVDGHVRSEMRLHKLWHRATYIIIRHEDEENDNNDDNTYLLVQRRSNIKDYCPGKLDPAPGGVVGYNEEYEINAEREMMEEMGIDTTKKQHSTMTKLFVFPYEDEKVRVWGGMFEVVYKGKIDDITIQSEEVSEVIRLSITEIEHQMNDVKKKQDWMPDGLYAMKLYIQYNTDRNLGRRMLKGYSNGNMERYTLRPKPQVIFFDCDDCLYFDNWNVAKKLTSLIEDWCTTKKNLPKGKAYELYKKHGTALKGLINEGYITNNDNDEIDAYLRDVHDLPIEDLLQKDDALRTMLLNIDPSIPKYVFTASVRQHAERCLKALGIDDLFVDIIDVKSCKYNTKHSIDSFHIAMDIASVTNPESCIFFDDSLTNIKAARSVGWRSFLVGKVARDTGNVITTEHAEYELNTIHEVQHCIPEIFS